MLVKYRFRKLKQPLSKRRSSIFRATQVTLVTVLTGLFSQPATADLDFTETLDPTVLVNQVINPEQNGIIINSVTVFGGDGQIATFTNGLSVPNFITFEEGIILSSGQVSSLVGPNAADGTGSDVPAIAGADGDPDFDSLSNSPQGTFDAAYIEIDFTPSQNMVTGTFVFASDEYNEYAPPAGSVSEGNTYYDVMAFFVNGVNQSITASGENVSINSVNETLNSADFNSNDREDDGTPTPVNIEADGFTRKLTWTATVTPNVSNTLKFGVADGGDASYNSWLLVDKYAFEVAPPPATVDLTLLKTDNTDAVAVGVPLTYEFAVRNIGSGPTGREIVVTDTLPAGVTVNSGEARALLETGENGDEWTCQSDAGTPQTVMCKSTVDSQTGSGNDTSVFSFTTDPIGAALDGSTLVNNATVSTTDVDSDSSNDTASDSTLVTTTDVTAPTAIISGSPSVVETTAPFTVTIEFNEDVTGLTASDLVLTNALASNLIQLDASTYTVDVTPNAAGDIDLSLPANAAQDSAGNANLVSNSVSTSFNSNAVGLTLLNVPAFVATPGAYTVQFEFSEDVAGFTLADVIVLDGSASNFVALDGNSYTADITPDGTGDITVSVAGAAATDLAGLDPTLSASATTVYNISAPTVEVQGAPAAVNTLATFPITIQFSEAVTDFVASDVLVSNGLLSNFVALDADTYTADITPEGNGDILIDVPVNAAIDVASNGNQASGTVTTVFDVTEPALIISGLPALINSTVAVPVTFQFSEDVVGFEASDIMVTNGSLSNFVSIDGDTYTADVVPNGSGDVSVEVAIGAAQDATGNNNTADQASAIYDDVPPVLTINPVALDNIINAIEDDSPVAVSGGSTGLENGQAVVLSLNGVDYTAFVSNNVWSLSIPATDAQALAATETIVVNASDLAGNAATPVSLAIQHDTTAPATPTVTSVITNNINPVILGTASLSAGDVLTVEVDSVVYTAGDGFLSDNGDGTWQLNVPAANSISDGNYSVEALVTDAAGNTASDVSNNELQVDTVSPATPLIAVDLASVDDSGESDTDNNTNQSAANYSVPVGTATAGETVTLYANGVDVGTVVVAADGSFSLPSNALADGNYAIAYTLTDTAGNESSLSPTLSVTVDTVTPIPTVTTPIAGDGIVNESESDAVLLEGTAEVNAIVNVTFDDGVNPPISVSANTDNAGAWTLLGNEADLTSLADGVISVDVAVVDIAGNTNTSVTENITLDAAVPVVPSVTALVTNDTTPSITGTAVLEAGDVLVVQLNGASYDTSGPELTDNGDGTWELLVPAGSELSQANYEVLVSVTDAAGNTAVDNSSLELEVDITAPATPTVENTLSNTATPTITGNAVIAAGESLSVVVNGVSYTVGDGHLIDDGNGNWVLSIPSANALADASYDVVATVTDAAGNTATDSSATELLVDTTAPAVPTVNNQTSNTSTPVITGTVTLAAGESLSVVVDSVTYTVGDGSLVDNGDNTWTLTIPTANAAVDGSYDVSVIVEDAAGNSSTDTGTGELVIDTTAPVTPVVAPNLLSTDDSGSSSADNITNVSTPTFDVPAGTGVAGDSVSVFANGSIVGSGTVQPDGSFSVAVSSLADSNYAVTYQFTDTVGNASANSPSLNVTIDTMAVQPVISTPIEVDNIVNAVEDDDLLLQGSAESGSTVLVSVSDGVNPVVQQSVVADAGGQWTLLGSELNISSLNEGGLTVDATATDISGNSASALQVAITHETLLPGISVAAVTGDNLINAIEDNSAITVAGTTTNVEDGQILTVSLNGKSYTAVVASNAWSLSIPAIDAQVLSGVQALTADVQNLAGNAATQATQTITHDTTIPEISLNPVSTDDVINALEDNVDIVISGTSVDLEDGQSVTIVLNGNSYVGIVTADAWSVSLPAADAQSLPVSNLMSVDASDLAGNPALTVTKTITHDVTAPVVAIVNAPVATGANSATYVVSGSCTTGDDEVQVSIGSATPGSQSVLCNTDGEWFATFNVTSIADGTGTIIVNATQNDAAGNTTTAVAVTADKNTSVPSITINVVAGDDYINSTEDNANVTISGSTTDIEDGQIASIGLNGVTYNATVTTNVWSVSVPVGDVVALGANETVTADVANLAGTSAVQATREVIHDDAPPPVPGVIAVVTNSGTPVITGTATVVAGDSLTATVNGQTYTAGDGNLVDNGDGTWELTIPAGDSLIEGIYDVTVSIEDAAGNSVSEATGGELEVDTSAPSTPVATPNLIVGDDSGVSDSDDITNVLASTFDAPAGTGTNGDAVIVYADGVEIGAGFVIADGSFSIATVLPGDGLHAITFTLTDAAGNESVASPALNVTVDSSISAPSIDLPIALDNLVNATEDNAVLVTGTAEPDSNVDITFDDGTNPPVVVTVVTDQAGVWTLLGNEANLSGLVDGVISVDALSTDSAGNVASAIQESVVHDATPAALPTVTSLVSNSNVPVINGEATLGATDTLIVEVNGVTYTAGAGQLSDNGDGTWTLSIPSQDALADGVYTVTASVIDEAGNISVDSGVDELEVDTAAPVAPTVSSLISNESTPTLNGTVSLLAGESLTVTIDGNSYTTADALIVPGDGTWSLTMPVSDALADGSYEVAALVTDAAGNTALDASATELIVDTQAPTIPTITQVLTDSATPIITGTANVLSGETLSVTLNGVTYTNGDGSLTYEPDGSWQLEVPALNTLADANYEIVVSVTDLAGNVSVDGSTDELTVDTIAPAIPTVVAQSSSTGTPTIVGTANLAVGESLTVQVAGVSYPDSGPDLTTNGDGTWSLFIPAANSLAQATYDVLATVTDAAGNSTQDTSTSELLIDFSAPSSPVVNSLITNTSTPTISGTAVVGVDESLSVTLNGVTYTVGANLSLNGDDWTLTVPVANQ